MHRTAGVLVPRKEVRWYHQFHLFLALFQRQRENRCGLLLSDNYRVWLQPHLVGGPLIALL